MVQYTEGQAYPQGYTGKVISVMECATHGVHVNLDVVLTPNDAWETAKTLAAASTNEDMQLNGGVPVMVDQMTPDQCEAFAADLMEAVAAARQVIAGSN